MMAEKTRFTAEMERCCANSLSARPDYHHAYNALGYFAAERNVRRPEAKQLIQSAEFAPADPFIQDSLCGVGPHGNRPRRSGFSKPLQSKPDAESLRHMEK